MDTRFQIEHDGKHWKVELRSGDNHLEPGQTVSWEFGKNAQRAKAYFQFPSKLFALTNQDDPTRDMPPGLSKHHTAMADTVEHPLLTLTVAESALAEHTPTTYQYAVFVIPPTGDRQFAYGSNPPPEINVGP